MSTYLELKAQLATLDLKIEAALAGERAKAIREIQAKMVEWGIKAHDLHSRMAAKSKEKTK